MSCILIVDDDIDDRELFKEALEEIDPAIGCLTAYDGVNAFDILNSCQTHPNIIFLDLNMPRMNGSECLRILKQHEEWRGIPVVFYSTTIPDADRDKIMRLGAAHAIIKPTAFKEIIHEISEVLLRFPVTVTQR